MSVSKVSTVVERMARGLSPAQLAMLFELRERDHTDSTLLVYCGQQWRKTSAVLARRNLIEHRALWHLTDFGREILAQVEADVAARRNTGGGL